MSRSTFLIHFGPFSLVYHYHLKFLISCDVRGRWQFYGHTALILAVQSGSAECVRLLIDAGAEKEAAGRVRICRCVGVVVVIYVFPKFVADFSYANRMHVFYQILNIHR